MLSLDGFNEISYLSIFRKPFETIEVSLKSIAGTLHEDRYTFFIISRSVLIKMIIFSDKSCRENHNTRFRSNNFFLENRTVYWKMRKNIVERRRPYTAVWRMSFACWTTKAINILSEYVVLIAFPRQQWLHERALS
jgi:hypothetical protein